MSLSLNVRAAMTGFRKDLREKACARWGFLYGTCSAEATCRALHLQLYFAGSCPQARLSRLLLATMANGRQEL